MQKKNTFCTKMTSSQLRTIQSAYQRLEKIWLWLNSSSLWGICLPIQALPDWVVMITTTTVRDWHIAGQILSMVEEKEEKI